MPYVYWTDFVILTNDSFLSLPYRTMAMMIDLQWLSHKVIMRYFICFIYLVCMHVFRPLSWLSLFKNYILQVTWKQNKDYLSSYKKCLQIHIIVFWYLVWKTNLIDIFFEIEKTNRYWNIICMHSKGFCTWVFGLACSLFPLNLCQRFSVVQTEKMLADIEEK